MGGCGVWREAHAAQVSAVSAMQRAHLLLRAWSSALMAAGVPSWEVLLGPVLSSLGNSSSKSCVLARPGVGVFACMAVQGFEAWLPACAGPCLQAVSGLWGGVWALGAHSHCRQGWLLASAATLQRLLCLTVGVFVWGVLLVGAWGQEVLPSLLSSIDADNLVCPALQLPFVWWLWCARHLHAHACWWRGCWLFRAVPGT